LPDYASFVLPTLRRDRQVTALSAGTDTQMVVGDARIDVVALDRIRGDAIPTVLAGRAPARPGEIAIGGRSLREIGASVGGLVTARIGTRSTRLRIVGQTVMPEFGDAGQLGTGSLMTVEGLARLLPKAPMNSFLVRFGAARGGRAEGARLARAVSPIPSRFQARPQDLIELSHGGGLLVALVVLLSALAFAVLLHALITSVRAREHDFGVLRALGFARGQMRATVMWQVLTLVAVSFVIGMPLGSLLGRRAWLLFAHQLGVASDAVYLSASFVAVVGAGALVLALLAAIVPAGIAARTHPTKVLHGE
jgi:putative ABC transport system permease protein